MALKKIMLTVVCVLGFSGLYSEDESTVKEAAKKITLQERLVAIHENGWTQKIVFPAWALFAAYDLWRKHQNEVRLNEARSQADKEHREMSDIDEEEIRNAYENLFLDLSPGSFGVYFFDSLMGQHSKLNMIQSWSLLYILGQYGYKVIKLLRASQKKD